MAVLLMCNLYFYPRSPCGERRGKSSRRCVLSGISIHALLAESDREKPRQTRTDTNFYPRSPCGERHRFGRPIDVQLVFLSTLSLRRATPTTTRDNKNNVFLSTLSLRRATFRQCRNGQNINNFYPRSPCGERLVDALELANAMLFLSTLSLRRATHH